VTSNWALVSAVGEHEPGPWYTSHWG